MIEHLAFNLASVWEHLSRSIERTYDFRGHERLPEFEKHLLRNGSVKRMAAEIERLGLSNELKLKADNLITQLAEGSFVSPPAITRELELFKSDCVMELVKHKFVYIPSPGDQYFEKEFLFGEQVYSVLPESRQDIKDAGNCIAASLDTAAVFHLMRAAEHGLRALARRLRVKLKHKGQPFPLELGDWENVITETKNKITAARQLPKASKQRKAKLELYSDAADHCTFMKDIWRNNMAHTRKPYKQSEAIAILERVRDFMQFLGRIL